MTRLLLPGDHRAGTVMTDEALLDALVAVEQAWLEVRGVAAGDADLTGLLGAGDIVAIAERAEAGGNPVIALVGLLRERLVATGREDTAKRLHRGLTSQDVLDTALVLCAREGAGRVRADVRRQVAKLRDLAVEHRDTVRVARTLTQYAVPTTFGLVAATWLRGLLDAAEDLDRATAGLPVQLGGAAGTLAGIATQGDPGELLAAFAERLGLAKIGPWHTERAPVTRLGDALVGLHDTWGRIAADVLLGSRPEVAELAESSPGGSSTMPHKQNPALSTLVRSAALAAPQLGATLHVAAAAAVDQRPDGGWHAEWPALAALVRRSVVTASQVADLVEGLVVHAETMTRRAEEAGDLLLAEARSLGADVTEPRDYLGAAGDLIDSATARAVRYLERNE